MDRAALWLASTKLRPPKRRGDALLRPRLMQLFQNGLGSARLLLVSAPAGSGKSTFLAELPHVFPQVRWAWLILDEEDNDPTRFVAALRAALIQEDPEAASVGAEVGPQVAPFDGKAAAATLINDMIRQGDSPRALVLDDLQFLSNSHIHETLEYFIERMPSTMQVVIGSRTDPPIALSRWRARGELVEIRLADLSFTESEAEELLNTSLQLSVDGESLHRLHVQTEGWAAGLRLLANSLQQASSGRGAFLDRGIHGRERVFEFLVDEVFVRLDPLLQGFLLETSILSSLRPEDCDRLTGRTDSAEILERLYRQNLYVAVTDEAEGHYRYHDLFAAFLRERFRRERPDEWTGFHERAAQIARDPAQRLRHWILVGNWDQAAEEIERVGPDYLRRGFAVTLHRWILEIPEPVRRAHPRLSLLLGTSTWVRSELQEAQAYFEEARDGFERLEDRVGQGESLVALSITAIMFSQPERAETLFQQAMKLPLPASSRLELHTGTGWDALNRRDWAGLQRNLEELLGLLADPAVSPPPFALALVVYGTSFPEFLDRLESALPLFVDRLIAASDFGRTYGHALRAACLQFRGDIPGSLRMAEEVLRFEARIEAPLLARMSSLVTQQLAAYAAGDWDRAYRVSLRLTEEHSTAPFLRRWRPMATYFQGRALWLKGDAAGLAECYRRIASPEPEESPQANIYRVLLFGILRLNERALAKAQDSFEQAVDLQKEFRVSEGSCSAAVLLAYVLLRRGKAAEALEVFSPYLAALERLKGPGYLLRENPLVVPLLRLHHEKGGHRPFIERTLELLGAPLSAVEATGGESLSAREMEVLRTMAEGLSNKAIGEKLFVSEATVKTHVQRILRKLEASSRTQALARARDLMII